MRQMFVLLLVCFLCFLWPMGAIHAAEPAYWQDVRPLLRRHCTVCHSTRNLGEVEVSGGLALDSYEAVVRGTHKPLVRPGKSADSLIVELVTTADTEKRMPLGAKPVPPEVVAVFKRWIDAGAKEGPRPDAEATTVASKSTRPRRKLEVTLATTAVPPPGIFGNTPPAALQLVLREGPLPPVTAVAFSPDGKLLAAGAYGVAAIWNLETARPLKVLTNVLGTVNDLRFSPDGKWLAVAGGQPSARGDLRLFRAADWKLAATLGGHEDVVACVAFSPDGKRLASASFDRSVRVWDIATHQQEMVLTGHSDFVYAVAWSADGGWLASASKDRSVKVVDARTGKGRFTFSGMNEDVLAVAVTPDGKQVVSSGVESGLYWWDPATGSRLRVQGGHSGAVNELCFSKDGKLLASASNDGTVRLWNPATVTLLATLGVGSRVYATALTPDGKQAATGSFDGLVRLWDASNGRQLATLLTLPRAGEEPGWLALTPEGYAAGSAALLRDGRWLMGNQAIPSEGVWRVLAKTEAVRGAVHGDKVLPPFGK
jgi:WD40 repeat protein